MGRKFYSYGQAANPHRWLSRQLLAFSLATGFISAMAAGCTGSVSSKGDGNDHGGAGGGDVDNGGSGPGPSACESRGVGSGRWRRLTARQYAATVKELLGQAPDTSILLGDSRTGPFKTNALFPVEEGDVGAYDTLAKTLSEKAVGDLSSLLSCDTKTMGEDRCATRFIETFGARAYRRPLQSDEKSAFAGLYMTGKEESFASGIRLVVQAMLSSPNFLYLVEAGAPDDNGMRKLNGYEMASRLAYTLTGTMPDADLFSAAADGKLDTVEGVQSYAKKLIATDRFIDVAKEFHVELLGIDAVTTAEVSKSGRFPDFTEEMRQAMGEEPRKFVGYVMTKGSGSVEEMFTGAYVFPQGPLARVYGDRIKASDDGRAEVSDGSRQGLLTLAGVLASHPAQLSPRGAVNRGHLVRRDVLCEVVPPPTVKVDFTLPPDAETKTAQELLRIHQENPSCKGCHQLMDSIGFGFENYDPMGAFRTKDGGGHDIDGSGEIVNIEGDGKFSNAKEMSGILAKSPEVRTCMSQQWIKFALGRDPQSEDACSINDLTKTFLSGKGDIKSAVLSLVASDSFRFYRGQ